MKRRVLGFTLIELLIVVAILSILTMMAAVNYQEASVRSKVSRVRAELKVVGDALEMYAVDYNHYPYRGQYKCGCLLRYMATDQDLFAQRNKFQNIGYEHESGQTFSRTPYKIEVCMDPMEFGLRTIIGESGDLIYKDMRVNWLVASNGPDEDWFNGYPAAEGVPNTIAFMVPLTMPYRDYDPTNGTTSAGNIFRTNANTSGLGVNGILYEDQWFLAGTDTGWTDE
ncbi:MAG: prepilin-type N-terminal cleavage/methylation domain-containing protein [Candidatus Sumerlaeaceae bacterium]|nr:prepilin-type N-terminal cleavage/methylation domain-containing protein [Candidatus Sumerlaeaceae bacterium]